MVDLFKNAKPMQAQGRPKKKRINQPLETSDADIARVQKIFDQYGAFASIQFRLAILKALEETRAEAFKAGFQRGTAVYKWKK